MNGDVKGLILGAIIACILIAGPILLYLWVNNDDSNTAPGQSQTKVVTPDPAGYTTCSEAHDAGVYDIPDTDPAYKERQDADNDGYACEPYFGR